MPSTGSPSSDDVRYLDFETASALVEAARDVAVELGRPARVPPVRIQDCDQAIIRSALAAPMAGFGGFERYPDMPSKAACLLYSLAKSQACNDGNKRLALIVVVGFLRLNGMELAAGNTEVAETIERIGASDPADRQELVEELTEWFRATIRRRVP